MLHSWDEQTASSTPTHYLVDHTDEIEISLGGRSGQISNGRVTADVTTTVRNWVNGDPNNGILVIDCYEAMLEGWYRFWSCEAPSEHCPYIQVTFHSKEGYVHVH